MVAQSQWQCPTVRQFTPITDIPSRQRLLSSLSADLLVRTVRLPTILDVASSLLPALAHGTTYWSKSPQCHLCSPSEATKTASGSTFISWRNLINRGVYTISTMEQQMHHGKSKGEGFYSLFQEFRGR